MLCTLIYVQVSTQYLLILLVTNLPSTSAAHPTSSNHIPLTYNRLQTYFPSFLLAIQFQLKLLSLLMIYLPLVRFLNIGRYQT